MDIVTRQQIEASLDLDETIAAIERGFIDYSAGRSRVPPVAHIEFADPAGDCHVKCGHIRGDGEFVVKVATGFYRNPERGLSSSNGCMLLVSAVTGEPLALLEDGGSLTDLRTAIAGLVAAKHLAPAPPVVLGIVGTGIQARLQRQLLMRRFPESPTVIWGRRAEAVERFALEIAAEGRPVAVVASVRELCERANLIVTTTPSVEPLLQADWVHPGTHITAVGADAPGKQELDPRLFARAAVRVVDSLEQCAHHGEAGHALRASVVAQDQLLELGRLLVAPELGRGGAEQITVADLTGVAVQDIRIAQCVWRRFRTSTTPLP
jgi:ornithine cyclodeaminase